VTTTTTTTTPAPWIKKIWRVEYDCSLDPLNPPLLKGWGDVYLSSSYIVSQNQVVEGTEWKVRNNLVGPPEPTKCYYEIDTYHYNDPNQNTPPSPPETPFGCDTCCPCKETFPATMSCIVISPFLSAMIPEIYVPEIFYDGVRYDCVGPLFSESSFFTQEWVMGNYTLNATPENSDEIKNKGFQDVLDEMDYGDNVTIFNIPFPLKLAKIDSNVTNSVKCAMYQGSTILKIRIPLTSSIHPLTKFPAYWKTLDWENRPGESQSDPLGVDVELRAYLSITDNVNLISGENLTTADGDWKLETHFKTTYIGRMSDWVTRSCEDIGLPDPPSFKITFNHTGFDTREDVDTYTPDPNTQKCPMGYYSGGAPIGSINWTGALPESGATILQMSDDIAESAKKFDKPPTFKKSLRK
jgi:hypothetical protein